MTDDLVKRLRAIRIVSGVRANRDVLGTRPIDRANETVHESADRIESLEAENARLRHAALVREERIAEMERQLHAAIAEVSEAGRRQGEAEAKLAKAVEAVEGVMIGGNHLVALLPDNILSPETGPLEALEIMGSCHEYDAWCCWRSIMLARTTLAEIEDAKQSAEASVVRRGKRL